MKSGYCIDYSMYLKEDTKVSKGIDFLIVSWKTLEILDDL